MGLALRCPWVFLTSHTAANSGSCMALVSSLRSRNMVQDHTRAAKSDVRVAPFTRRGVFVEVTARDHVQLATRSSASVSHSNLVFASVFGSIGIIALVAFVILLVRYWKRRQDAIEDMIIERPSHTFQDTQDTTVHQNALFSAPIQNDPVSVTPPTLDTPDRAYIPNHPYALYYTRDSLNSFPPTPPAKPATRPQTQYPPLSSLTFSHPYKQSAQPQQRQRVPSMDPSTNYESFMSHDSPIPSPEPAIEPMEPSPLASTVGGALSHHGSQFDALLSPGFSDEAPSSFSASSSAPLRPGDKQPHR